MKAIYKNTIGGYAGQYFFWVFFNQYHRFILEIIGKNSGKITVSFFVWVDVKQKSCSMLKLSMYGYSDEMPILEL